MYERWFELIDKFGGNEIKLNTQLEAKKEDIKKEISIIKISGLLKFVLTFLLVLTIYLILNFSSTEVVIFIRGIIVLMAITMICNIKFIIQCLRTIRFSKPKEKLRAVAKVVIKSLCDV